MRNLFLFLIRFNYIFIFLILEAIAMVFVIRNHAYHRTGFLNSTGVVTANVNSAYHRLGEYLSLSKVNERLMEENSMLRMQRYVTSDTMASIDICDDSARVQYRFIPAKVINFSVSRSNNYITLDRGSKTGIQRDMGVITSNGVVGIVNQVSENFATAMSVLHTDCRINVKIKRFNYPGTVTWKGGDPSEVQIMNIPSYLPIAKGDSVISGFSTIFPENIPVGVISEFETPPGGSVYSITVKLSADMETLQHAYVVNNLRQKEQRALEEQNHD